MRKIGDFYKKWKAYMQVDLIMYASMILFIILLFIFFG